MQMSMHIKKQILKISDSFYMVFFVMRMADKGKE